MNLPSNINEILDNAARGLGYSDRYDWFQNAKHSGAMNAGDDPANMWDWVQQMAWSYEMALKPIPGDLATLYAQGLASGGFGGTPEGGSGGGGMLALAGGGLLAWWLFGK